jgi:hypothetical protein
MVHKVCVTELAVVMAIISNGMAGQGATWLKYGVGIYRAVEYTMSCIDW